MEFSGPRGVSVSNRSSVGELVCRSSSSEFFKFANMSLLSDSQNEEEEEGRIGNSTLNRPKPFLRQFSNADSSTTSGARIANMCSSDFEDEEELSLFGHSAYTVYGTSTNNTITGSCREYPATCLPCGLHSLIQKKLDVPVSRRKRSSSDSALSDLPKISKVHKTLSLSCTFKDMIRQSFLDSSSGNLDETNIESMCRVFGLSRKTILKSFNNHRHYIETKIQTMLIDMNVEDLSSPWINQIASKLRSTTLKVKNCFNKYSQRIQEAIKAKKTKPPMSDVTNLI